MVKLRSLAAVLPLMLLPACGLQVPDKDPLSTNDIRADNGMSRQGIIESNIIANVRCEVTRGLYNAVTTGGVPWISEWGTSISLNLTWEESTAANAGLLHTTPIGGADVFSIGGGLSGSARATRNESVTMTLENRELINDAILNSRRKQGHDCSGLETGVTVSSNLKIDEFIYDKATIAVGGVGQTRSNRYPQFSNFQETLTFVVSVGGSVTPSWKFVRLTVNPAGPTLGVARTNTSQIIITLGPLAKPGRPAGSVELATQAAVQHDAAVWGAATAAAIRGQAR